MKEIPETEETMADEEKIYRIKYRNARLEACRNRNRDQKKDRKKQQRREKNERSQKKTGTFWRKSWYEFPGSSPGAWDWRT